MRNYYVATVHLLVELDDDGDVSPNSDAGACDTISEILRNAAPYIRDWAYARTNVPVAQAFEHPSSDGKWAKPVEIELPKTGIEYEEGDFLALIPDSHRITKE